MPCASQKKECNVMFYMVNVLVRTVVVQNISEDVHHPLAARTKDESCHL